MKKTNARRIMAFVLALIFALPVLSIPTTAQGVTQSYNSSDASASMPEALYIQDFEAFDTLKGPVKPGSAVFKGPSSARIVPSADGHGNVLQINCAPGALDGKYWFNPAINDNWSNNNAWIQITSVEIKKNYNHPSGELGENVKGFNGVDTYRAMIFTTYTETVIGGTVKTPGGDVYIIRGEVNEDGRVFHAKLFYNDGQTESLYKYAYDYEYEYEIAYEYVYVYEYEYEYEYTQDKNGETVVKTDKDGNPVYALDEFGLKIPVKDENGDPVYATDEAGNLIRKKDANGNDIVLTDENGEMVINRYVYEYQKDENGEFLLDNEGKKIPVLDGEGNPVIATNEYGTKLFAPDGEGEYAALLDVSGNPMPLYYPDGTKVPKLDADGNKIILRDENGEPIMSENPLLDEYGYPVVADKTKGKEYILDAEGNKIPLLDANGNEMPLEIPLANVNYGGYDTQTTYETIPYYVTMLDEEGNTLLDENGDPVYKLDENGEKIPVMVDKLVNGQPVWVNKYFPVFESDGVTPVMIQKLDSSGEPAVDEEGNPIMVQKTETRTENQVDPDGNIVYKQTLGNALRVTNPDGTTSLTKERVPDYQPVQVPRLDAQGKQVYDKYGNEIYDTEWQLQYKSNGEPKTRPPREIIVTPVQVNQMEYAQEQKVDKIPHYTQIPKAGYNYNGGYIMNSGVRDSFGGGYSNVATPAYIQSGMIKDDVLLFSSDYYFSADDPDTPENEALSRGFDLRVNVTDQNGKSKAFDFISAGIDGGYIVLKPHTDAPTVVVDGSIKVKLGTWCNIMIAADLTAGTYAVYVNGQLAAMRQNVKITAQDVKKDVLINSQTAYVKEITDDQGNPVMVPMRDEDGNIVMTIRKNADGTEMYYKQRDENGNYVYDIDGNHVMIPDMVPIMVPEIERWSDGTPKYTYITGTVDENTIVMPYHNGESIQKDENGNVIMRPVKTMNLMENLKDENGNLLTEVKKDASGKVVEAEILNADGTPRLDSAGNPLKAPMLVLVQEEVMEYKMVQKVENGQPVWETRLVEARDENGNVIMVDQLDEYGSVVYDKNGMPIKVPQMVIEKNPDGTDKLYPVLVRDQETIKDYAPDSGKWTVAGVSVRGGTWNLGHFLRGGKASDYRGYMLIDNLAIYSGDDITKVFTAKGYSIDFAEDYESYDVGSVLPLDKTDSKATVTDMDGDKVLKFDFSDAKNEDANFRPATNGFSYLSSDKVVLEANYYLEAGSKGKFQSQFYMIGAFPDIENAPFKLEYTGKAQSRSFQWVDLYWIEAKTSSAVLTIHSAASGKDESISFPMNEWTAVSTIVDLKTGEYTIYIDGVVAFSDRLAKLVSYKNVEGTEEKKNIYFTNISVPKSSWIVSKINKDQSGLTKSFYIDDVVVTTMGAGAKMQRVEGMLSAKISSNGKIVKEVTDNNLFFTSSKIQIVDVKTYDIGTEQLLKSDDTTIRFTSPAGIRFSSLLDLDALNALYDQIYLPAKPGDPAAPGDGSTLRAVRFGTLIIPTDILDGRDLTFEVLEDNNLPYLDVIGHEGQYYDLDGKEGTTHIVGSIIDIKEENIDRLFSAVNYVRIVLDNGIVYNIYSNRVINTSAQSMADDAYGEYTLAEQAVIDAYFAGKKPASDIQIVAD